MQLGNWQRRKLIMWSFKASHLWQGTQKLSVFIIKCFKTLLQFLCFYNCSNEKRSLSLCKQERFSICINTLEIIV